MKQHDAIDLLKFVMAISIVAMHSNLFYGCPLMLLVWPWSRISVPLFFIISSYFYFKSGQKFAKFFFRVLSLYLIWFCLTLPDTIASGGSYWVQGESLTQCVLRYCASLLFSGTFGATWYLSALVWGIYLLEAVVGKMSPKRYWSFILGGYFLCTLASMNDFALKSSLLVFKPQQSFCIGVVWCAIGTCLCDWKDGLACLLRASATSQGNSWRGCGMSLALA